MEKSPFKSEEDTSQKKTNWTKTIKKSVRKNPEESFYEKKSSCLKKSTVNCCLWFYNDNNDETPNNCFGNIASNSSSTRKIVEVNKYKKSVQAWKNIKTNNQFQYGIQKNN